MKEDEIYTIILIARVAIGLRGRWRDVEGIVGCGGGAMRTSQPAWWCEGERK